MAVSSSTLKWMIIRIHNEKHSTNDQTPQLYGFRQIYKIFLLN
jgi:hypothetical protein